MLRRVLVANRGEIAVRVIRACKALGIETVAVFSEADRGALHTRLAERAVCIGPARAAESYLNVNSILAAALGTGCDAVHPGYGFPAENAGFAEACVRQGLVFVGPPAEVIATMGDKARARATAAHCGVPIVPGTTLAPASAEEAAAEAARIGYPVLLKAAAGGGGRGMRVVRAPEELSENFARAAAEAEAAFADGRLYLERYLEDVRHVEVQVLADNAGNVLDLGERDCSIQRRHQKLLEEAPSPELPDRTRRDMVEAALAITRSIGYRNAGTLEFVLDRASGRFYFIEMNTRVQVEHPVTEMLTGVDIVAEQLRIAAGLPLTPARGDRLVRGHAIECRINAEDPQRGFQPSPGVISSWSVPQGVGIRVDTHCEPGFRVPPFYDSLLAKVIVLGGRRDEAIAMMRSALARFEIGGVASTVGFHQALLETRDFVEADVNTRWVEERFMPTLAA